MGKAAILRLVGLSVSDSVIEPAGLLVGGVTLRAMVAFLVWSREAFLYIRQFVDCRHHVAFVLNLIFRIGISQKASLLLSPQLDVGAEIYRFLENQGANWGARPQVLHEPKHILRELIEALYMHAKTNGPVHIEALFDEYNLNIHVNYTGEPMEFRQARPPKTS